MKRLRLWMTVMAGVLTIAAGAQPYPESFHAKLAEGTTVKGNLTFANLVGPAAQGIDGTPETRTPEEFAEILKAIRAGLTYANVHSTKFPPGEIRGQIRAVKSGQ